MTIDQQLKLDRHLYGMSFERFVDGKRGRLDPTTIKMVTVKPKKIPFYPEPVLPNTGIIKIETK